MYDVITIGAATKDVFLFSDQFQILNSPQFDTGVGECVSLGSKIEISRIVETTGGGATNAAVTFARFGMRTAVACKVGADANGRDILSALKAERVNVSLVAVDAKVPTAYSTLLTTNTGERTVLVYRGASANFKAADVAFAKCSAKWFYVTSLGGDVALAAKIVAHAAKCGSQVAWNPGGKELDAGLKKLLPIIKNVRVLSVNREEGARLAGSDDVYAIIAALATPGNVVIVTDGAKGAYAHADGNTVFSPGTGKKAISQTGAGDAFGSGFVAAFMKTEDIRDGLAVGALNAESVIGKVGPKEGILRAWPTPKQMATIKISQK